MVKFVWIIWLLLPFIVLAWHFGPGQRHWKANKSGAHIRAAEIKAASEAPDWREIADLYANAYLSLPCGALNQQRRLMLAEASARIKAGEIAIGQQQLENLIADLEMAANFDRTFEIEASARFELAKASYYAAWLLRLEGATREEWEPEIELARDQFRTLAENSLELVLNTPGRRRSAAHSQFAIFARNLEASIRLQQLYLLLLKDIKLPEDCPPGQNLRDARRVLQRRVSQNS